MNHIIKMVPVLENILLRTDLILSGKHRTNYKDLLASSLVVKTLMLETPV